MRNLILFALTLFVYGTLSVQFGTNPVQLTFREMNEILLPFLALSLLVLRNERPWRWNRAPVYEPGLIAVFTIPPAILVLYIWWGAWQLILN